MLANLASLVFGRPTDLKKGTQVMVGVSTGCMAESIQKHYEGTVVSKTRVNCHGRPEGLPGYIIRVTKSHIQSVSIGDMKTELAERARTDTSNNKIIIN